MTAAARGAHELERFGPYAVLRTLPKGAMGMPSVAFHVVRGEQVLLKRLPAQHSASRDRFLDEIRLSSKIGDHPNLSRFVDAGNIQGRDYLAVEWIDGADLEHLVETASKWNMPVPVPVVLSVALQVLQGLAHLHAQGCIHRDVSAANIMVGYDGVARLVDYGIARYEGRRSHTIVGVTLGTPGFVAPELQTQQPATVQSDLYGVGASLWLLLTGARFPDSGSNDHDGAVLTRQLRKLGRVDATPELVKFLGRLLHHSPQARYQTAAEAAGALAQTPTTAAAAVADFVGILLAAEKQSAALRLAELRQRYQLERDSVEVPLPVKSIVVEPITVEQTGRGQAMTMLIEASDMTPSRAHHLLIAAIVAMSLAAIGGLKWVASHSPIRPTSKAPPHSDLSSRPSASAVSDVVKPALPLVVQPGSEQESPVSTVAAPSPSHAMSSTKATSTSRRPGSTNASATPSTIQPAAKSGAFSPEIARRRMAEARDLAAIGRTLQAREIYDELSQDSGARPLALVGLARLAYGEKQWDEAIRMATMAAKAGAGAEAFMVRGSIYLARRGQSDPERADTDFAKVLTLQPKNDDAAEGRRMAQQLMREAE